MTLEEFSNGFDTLVNSYKRFKDFDKKELLDSIEFNEYEKSLYLTKTQEEYVLSLYNGKNPTGASFESDEEARRHLSNLVREEVLEPIETSNGMPLGVDSSSKFFTLPDDLWFITYESVLTDRPECGGAYTMDVYPVRQDEYLKIRKNPFRGANGRRALRMDLSENNIEIICKSAVTSYYVRYFKKLTPIVLEDLPEGTSINGVDKATECELHEALHYPILEMAVLQAMKAKLSSASKEEK